MTDPLLKDIILDTSEKPDLAQALEALRPEITIAINEQRQYQALQPAPTMLAIIEKMATVMMQGYEINATAIDMRIVNFFVSIQHLFQNDEEFTDFTSAIRNAVNNKENNIVEYIIHPSISRAQTWDLDNLLRELHELQAQEPSVEVRYSKLGMIRQKLHDLVRKKKFLVKNEQRAQRSNDDDDYNDYYRRLMVEDIPNLYRFDTIYLSVGRSTSTYSDLEKITERIKRIEHEYEFFTTVGHVNEGALEENRMKFGAKGANLLALMEFLQKIQQSSYFKNRVHAIEVPPFQLVLADVYTIWKEGERDLAYAELKKVYNAVQGYGSVIIRSSAVYSEDGKETTGAGIYDSVFLKKESTFEQFIVAVEKVYVSCDSEHAKQYRANHEVPNESMGLVVQKAIYDEEMGKQYEYDMEDNQWLTGERGYANSTRPHSTNLLDVHYDSVGFPLIYKKDEIEKVVFSEDDSHGAKTRALYFEVDISQVFDGKVNMTVDDIFGLATMLERHYRCPVQIEYVTDPSNEYGNVFVVQVRPLPSVMFTQQKVEFPKDLEPIGEMHAVGFCDEVLDILPVVLSAFEAEQSTNYKKTGITFFHTTWMGSCNMEGVEKACPQKGVVVLLQETSAGRGHVETIALEKGLVLVFNRFTNERGRIHSIGRVRQASRLQVRNITSGIIQPAKLRVVANGTLARLYEVPVEDGHEIVRPAAEV